MVNKYEIGCPEYKLDSEYFSRVLRITQHILGKRFVRASPNRREELLETVERLFVLIRPVRKRMEQAGLEEDRIWEEMLKHKT